MLRNHRKKKLKVRLKKMKKTKMKNPQAKLQMMINNPKKLRTNHPKKLFINQGTLDTSFSSTK